MNGQQKTPELLESVQNATPHIGTKKKCTKCGKIKRFDEFYKDKRRIFPHLQSECKTCFNTAAKIRNLKDQDKNKEARRKWYLKNKSKVRISSQKWYFNNIEKAKDYNKKYHIENKEKCNAQTREWYLNNKERDRELHRLWRGKNPEKLKEQSKKQYLKKISTAQGKLNARMSNAIYFSLKGAKRKHWEDIVGYTVEQLKKHLEKQFKPGMTWGNYGRNGWHIDHKIPISAFNFEDVNNIDFKKCWELKNLQPMVEVENIKKGAKLNKPHQPSLLI